MATSVGAASRHPPADREYIGSLSEPHTNGIPELHAESRTLNEGGREVFELLSDSEPDPDDGKSDAEVMETLQRTSRSSSAVPLSDANDVPDDKSDIEEPDTASETLSDEDSGASIQETQSDIIPSAPMALTTVQSIGPSAAEFQPSAPSDSSFNSPNAYDFNNFDFDSLMLNLEGAMNNSSFTHDPATTELFAYDPAFDSSLFAESIMLMPSSAPLGSADPLQDFLDLHGDYGGFFDAGAAIDSGSFTARSYDEPPLLLPPAPPESPPALSPSVEHRQI
ncbi:hypothetical protein B0H11DRAFT_1935338 [Mycena galericulata]|nr:hypothetical protein B0H11DRAFT_1935338 [Mycena galericulata]